MHSGELLVFFSFIPVIWSRSTWNFAARSLSDIISGYSFNADKAYLVPTVFKEDNFCYKLIHV